MTYENKQYEILFQWLSENLSELITESFDGSPKCTRPEIHQLICALDYELIINLLDLTDEELEKEFPFSIILLSFAERQDLKVNLEAHIIRCEFCRMLVLNEKIEDSIFNFCLSRPDLELALA